MVKSHDILGFNQKTVEGASKQPYIQNFLTPLSQKDI